MGNQPGQENYSFSHCPIGSQSNDLSFMDINLSEIFGQDLWYTNTKWTAPANMAEEQGIAHTNQGREGYVADVKKMFADKLSYCANIGVKCDNKSAS